MSDYLNVTASSLGNKRFVAARYSDMTADVEIDDVNVFNEHGDIVGTTTVLTGKANITFKDQVHEFVLASQLNADEEDVEDTEDDNEDDKSTPSLLEAILTGLADAQRYSHDFYKKEN